MRLTIEIDENEMKNYADTVCAFVGTIAGNRAPHQTPIPAQSPVVTPTIPSFPPVHQNMPCTTTPVQTVTEPPEEPVDTNAPTVDAVGMPWDERIHSPNKTRIANGQWRKKKGVDDAMVAAVEAERRGMQQSAPVQPATIPQLTAAEASAALFGQFANQQQQSAPVQPATSPVNPVTMPQQNTADQFAQFAGMQQQNQPVMNQQPQPMQQIAAAPQTFQEFMKIIANGVNTGKIDPNYIMSLCQRCGIQAITDLGANPTLIPTAYAFVVADGRA